MIRAIFIPVKGNVETIEHTEGDTLRWLQKHVGGNIEGVPLKDGNEMYVNESGLIDQLPLNQRATFFARKHFAYGPDELVEGWPGVTLYGDAIVVAINSKDGETASTTLEYTE